MFKLLHSSLLCIYCEVIRMFGSLLGILEEGERVRDLGKILKHVLKIRHSFFKLKENTSLHWENHIQPNKSHILEIKHNLEEATSIFIGGDQENMQFRIQNHKCTAHSPIFPVAFILSFMLHLTAPG